MTEPLTPNFPDNETPQDEAGMASPMHWREFEEVKLQSDRFKQIILAQIYLKEPK